MARSSDVLVMGGGVIGLTSAYYLAKAGLRVTVLERSDLGQEASWAGAGIISAGNPRRARTPLGQLKALSAEEWPRLTEELREKTGIDNGYWRCGSLEVRRSADEVERQRVANLLREERGEGVEGQLLDAQQLRAFAPALSENLPGAVFFPDVAQVRNPWHLRALVAACTQLGVDLQPKCAVQGFDVEHDTIIAARTEEATWSAGQFLLTGGAWSSDLGALLGCTVPVRPIRGQIVLLHPTQLMLRQIVQAGNRYLVPRRDGRWLLGSTEEDVGFDKRTTETGIQGLLDFGWQLVPPLRVATVEKTWAGLRPGSADGRPYLGALPGWSNAYLATGHYRSGITLSVATGLVMTDLLNAGKSRVPLDTFRVDRSTRANVKPWEAN